MARILPSGYDRYTRHAITHGVMSDRTLDVLRKRAERSSRGGSALAREFRERAYAELSNLDLSLVRDRVRSSKRRFDERLDSDVVHRLVSIQSHQQAKMLNRRLMMMNPRARKLYDEGLIVGYHGQFADDEPGRYGRDHSEYRIYYSGSFVEEGEEAGFVTYLEDDLIEYTHDRPSELDKRIVRDNHVQQNHFFDEGSEDPTNQLGGTI